MLFRGLTALLILLFLSLMVIANTGNGTYLLTILNSIPFGDKLLHILMMGSLTAGLNLSWNFKTSKFFGREIWTGTLIMSVLISLEEVSQGFIPYRNFEVADLFCNYLGIYVLGTVPYFLIKWKQVFMR